MIGSVGQRHADHAGGGDRDDLRVEPRPPSRRRPACGRRRRRRAARWPRWRCRSWRPRRAASRARQRSWHRITGAASTPERVKRAALTVPGVSETSRPRSVPPLGLRPAATPAARKPCGSPPGGVDRVVGQRHPAAHRQPLRLVAPEHQVEVLHRLRRRALPQVVDRGEHEHAAGAVVAVDGDAAVVGVAHLEHAGRPERDLDPRLALVGLAVEVGQLALAQLDRRRDVARHQLALRERDEVRREGDRQRRPQHRELLLDLRRVAVALDLVRGHVLVGRDVVRGLRRLAAGAADARLRVDHHVVDRARPRQRRQRRAARRSGSSRGWRRGRRPAICLAVELGQPVDRGAEQLGRAVRAVPVLVGRRGRAGGSRPTGRRRARRARAARRPRARRRGAASRRAPRRPRPGRRGPSPRAAAARACAGGSRRAARPTPSAR